MVFARTLVAKNQAHSEHCELLQVVPGYEPLAEVLRLALEQAQGGKGKERHATEQPFVEQPSMADARLLGVAGPVFQARKKLLEASRCCEVAPERAIPDLLGAMVYAAMAVLVIEGRAAGKDAAQGPWDNKDWKLALGAVAVADRLGQLVLDGPRTWGGAGEGTNG